MSDYSFFVGCAVGCLMAFVIQHRWVISQIRESTRMLEEAGAILDEARGLEEAKGP